MFRVGLGEFPGLLQLVPRIGVDELVPGLCWQACCASMFVFHSSLRSKATLNPKP